MTSLDLVRQLHQRGLLTKEAAIAVLRSRENLIKQALAEEATRLFENLESMAKHAGIGSLFGRAGAVAEESGGMLSKLKKGGLTGGGGTPAGWSDVGSNLLKMLGIAGLSAGATAGVSSLFRHRRDQALQQDIANSYRNVFKEQPELEQHDANKVRNNFAVLAKFAPSLAADPIVASSFLKQTVGQDIIEPSTIKMLTETQRRIDEMHEARSPFASHFDRGVSMAQKAMSPGSKPSTSSG